MNVEMTNGYTRFGGDITMAKEKQISTDSVKHGHAYDNNRSPREMKRSQK